MCKGVYVCEYSEYKSIIIIILSYLILSYVE